MTLVINIERIIYFNTFIFTKRSIPIKTICIRIWEFFLGFLIGLFIQIFMIFEYLLRLKILLGIFNLNADFKFIICRLSMNRFIFFFLVFVHYLLLNFMINLIFVNFFFWNIFSLILSLLTHLTRNVLTITFCI